MPSELFGFLNLPVDYYSRFESERSRNTASLLLKYRNCLEIAVELSTNGTRECKEGHKYPSTETLQSGELLPLVFAATGVYSVSYKQ